MTYTLIGVTGSNLDEIYSVKIGSTYYSLIGPYLNTGDFTRSLSGTQNAYFTKITSGDNTSIFILAPPIHRGGDKLLLISNDSVLDLGASTFASFSITTSDITPNPQFIGNSITIQGADLLGVESVTFGNNATTRSFTFSPDGKSINNCIVPEDAGSGFLKVTNFVASEGVSSIPFFPFPRIDTLTYYTGIIGGTVTIIGKSFNHVTGVRFNSVLSKSFTVDSNYQITAIVPSGNVNGPISVSGYTGTFDVSDFEFNAIPFITGQSPLTGKRGAATTLLMTGAIPEILHAVETGVGVNTGYLVQFNGFNATGLFYFDGRNLTGIVPAKTKEGTVGIVKDNTLETYLSNYSFKISGINPTIDFILSADGFTGSSSFNLYGKDFFTTTGLALKHIDSNKIYDLPTGTIKGFKISQIGDRDDEFIVAVNGLTGIFPERTTASSIALQEGTYSPIFTDAQGFASEFVSPTGDFYFATKPSITGFRPTSGYLTSAISVFGTGLYPKTLARLEVTGKRISLARMSTVGGSNRTGLLQLKDSNNLEDILFPSTENPKELVTGFLYFENAFYAGGYATGNASGIAPFTIFGPPFISGFAPQNASVGDTVILSGLGFRDVQSVNLSSTNYSISSFNVVSTTGVNFLITDEIYRKSRGGDRINITASGGLASSVGILSLKGIPPVASGFHPQPAIRPFETILTGENLKDVIRINFSGSSSVGAVVSLNLSTSVQADTAFVTGSGIGTGVFLKFLSPGSVLNNEFAEIVSLDGISFQSLTRFRNEPSVVFTISGYSGLRNSFSGFAGDVFGITGSGFNSSSADIEFGTGDAGSGLFKRIKTQARVSDLFMTGLLEPGMNGLIRVTGSLSGETLSQQLEPDNNLVLFPQISGVGSTTMTEDDVFVVSGINNFNFTDTAFSRGDISGRFVPQIRLAITGCRYGNTTGIVEYINYDVSGLQIKDGNVIFSGRINSEFAGTGRLFLINPSDSQAVPQNSPYLNNGFDSFKNSFLNLSGFTDRTYLSRALDSFNETVTINEKQATISGFSPIKSALESLVTISGTSLRAVTGVAIFSGSTVSSSSAPKGYVSRYKSTERPENFSDIAFSVPADYLLSSGKIRLLSKNHSVDSNNFLTLIPQTTSFGFSPRSGVAGDQITLNGDDFSSVTQVFFKTDYLAISGVFSLVNENQIIVTVPGEGQLPAPQTVFITVNKTVDLFDTQNAAGAGGIILGEFEVRQGSEKFFGNIRVTGFISGSNFLGTGAGGRPTVNGSGVVLVDEVFGNIRATGFISGSNFLGSGAGGRPTVNGSGVLLVGEAAAGGGGGISITGGLDTDSASQIFTGNGVISLFGLNSGIHTGIKGSTQQIRSASVLVSIDGLMQNPVEHYAIIDPLGGASYSGLQFASVPITGADIEVRRFGDTVTIEITGLTGQAAGITANQAIIYALVLG